MPDSPIGRYRCMCSEESTPFVSCRQVSRLMSFSVIRRDRPSTSCLRAPEAPGMARKSSPRLQVPSTTRRYLSQWPLGDTASHHARPGWEAFWRRRWSRLGARPRPRPGWLSCDAGAIPPSFAPWQSARSRPWGERCHRPSRCRGHRHCRAVPRPWPVRRRAGRWPVGGTRSGSRSILRCVGPNGWGPVVGPGRWVADRGWWCIDDRQHELSTVGRFG
jgi:hypothetical protein